MNKKLFKEFEKIAKGKNIDTLEGRGRDTLDFHVMGVGTLVDMMEAAYELGRRDERKSHVKNL